MTLVAFDFDGTLTQSDLTVLLGREYDLAGEIRGLAEQGLRGEEVEFATTPRQRVSLLEGMPEARVEATGEKYGKLDAMVNNAGIGRVGTVEDMSLDDWRAIMRINLNGVMHETRAAMSYLKESEGSVINIASIYGLVAGPGATAYATAKGGIVNFTRSVAVDYTKQNVRVNSICPGLVEMLMTTSVSISPSCSLSAANRPSHSLRLARKSS